MYEPSKFKREIILSQVLLYGTLLSCIVLDPRSLGANAGISYFGHHRLTVIPFCVGFLASDWVLWRAARSIRQIPSLKFVYACLVIICAGMVGIIIAPAIGHGMLDALHRIFGSIIFITQLVLAGWIINKIRNDRVNLFLWGLQWLAGVVNLIYLNPADGFSIQAQILFQATFSALVIRSAKGILKLGFPAGKVNNMHASGARTIRF